MMRLAVQGLMIFSWVLQTFGGGGGGGGGGRGVVVEYVIFNCPS